MGADPGGILDFTLPAARPARRRSRSASRASTRTGSATADHRRPGTAHFIDRRQRLDDRGPEHPARPGQRQPDDRLARWCPAPTSTRSTGRRSARPRTAASRPSTAAATSCSRRLLHRQPSTSSNDRLDAASSCGSTASPGPTPASPSASRSRSPAACAGSYTVAGFGNSAYGPGDTLLLDGAARWTTGPSPSPRSRLGLRLTVQAVTVPTFDAPDCDTATRSCAATACRGRASASPTASRSRSSASGHADDRRLRQLDLRRRNRL